MLRRIRVANFRSIESTELELGPITIFFGETSSGKSSLLYALMAARNFVINPNQAVDGLFNLGFQNLGGFDQCIFRNAPNKSIEVALAFGEAGHPVGEFAVSLRKAEADIAVITSSISLKTKVSVPYALSASFPQAWSSGVGEGAKEFMVNWNGLAATVVPKEPNGESQAVAQLLAAEINSPPEALRGIEMVPHRRGFFKPSYVAGPPSPNPTTEDEVASLIINDMNAPPRISIDTEAIFDRDFRLYNPPGTPTTFLQTTEKKGKTPTLLVNDGFGVNQVVYMLAKIHRPEAKTLLIEEPEVHLHPTVIRRFARVACQITKEEGKQLVFTTHSEQFLLSILARVREGAIDAEDVRCYHAAKDGKRTTFHRQKVTPDGQIEGGLTEFMAGELEDIRTFLSVESTPEAAARSLLGKSK